MGSSVVELADVETSGDVEEGGKPASTGSTGGEEGDKAAKEPGPESNAAKGDIQNKTFPFWHLLREIHGTLQALDAYPVFLCKYVLLTVVQTCSKLALLVAIAIMGSGLDFTAITTEQYGVFGGVGALFVLGQLIPFFVSMQLEHLKSELSAAQATAVTAKLFDLPHDAMLSTPTGRFVQLISKVFLNLGTLLPGLYGKVVPMAAEVACATVLVGVLYGPIALVQPVLLVLYTIISYRAAARKAERNREMMMVMLSEWGSILDRASSYERAHYFGNVGHEVGGARESFDKIAARQMVVLGGDHVEGLVQNAFSLVVMVGYGFLVLKSSAVQGVEMLALIMYFSMFAFNLSFFAIGVSDLRTAVFEYQAFDDFLSTLSEVADKADAVAMPVAPKNPTIEFRDVSFSYGDRAILRNISFKVEGGLTLGLVGSSGCGKSTVMRLLMRFYQPTSGAIFVDGVNVADATASSLRELFSVVTQDAQLFNGTIRDNIDYGKMGSSDAAIVEAARLAELPLGEPGSDIALGKECGEKGAKLSGGQQQRVALARAMLKKGSIYLLDEPTTGLDGVVAKQLQRTLDTLSTNATTIMITHHLEDLKNTDTILYLDGGEIVERGSFEELKAADGEFAKQLSARANSGG